MRKHYTLIYFSCLPNSKTDKNMIHLLTQNGSKLQHHAIILKLTLKVILDDCNFFQICT